MSVPMEEKQLLPAIPVDFVVTTGLKANATEAKRRPYISLIADWARHEGMAEASESYISRLRLEGSQVAQLNEQALKVLLKPKYRDEESIALLRQILSEVDIRIRQNPNTWT